MYLITYPDYQEQELTVILHNLSVEMEKVLLPMFLDRLPEDSAIVLSNNFEWALKFKNAYWFVNDRTVVGVPDDHQYVLSDVDSAVNICADFFKKINIL